MEEEKIILIFSDLEGTILREEDGEYDSEVMYKFLSQLKRLQELTKAKVKLHLVSPVYKEQMEKVMDKIDNDIARFNLLQKNRQNDIAEIEGGTSSPEYGMQHEEFIGDKIVPLKKPINQAELDSSKYGKADYVRKWCEYYKGKGNLKTAIYCGNGRNDLEAMKYIKQTINGFVVCPDNSRHLAKDIADFSSNRKELLGITDGIESINKEIAKRIGQPDEKNQNSSITIEE